ncbi:MAG TPA: histidine--tRNA ligase [Candidatus Baltobacteraceae bacterium]|nr:histidine--tRNA ligase [Candidatus Baltobacteraceae bacterium]
MIKGVRGAPDILPGDTRKWQDLETVARDLLDRYGYEEIRTPIFERTDLFIRGIGEGTDIVEKEMYTFEDRGGESLTLRPEATASLMRAYMEHNLGAKSSLAKLYLIGPMFRHERPQSGRFRQFHQIDVEAVGSPGPAVDAEVVALLHHLLTAWGLDDLQLHINSIGDKVCRPAYREAFVAYFETRREGLCADCHVRLEKNPLRVLDCKQPGCQAIAAGAPTILKYLCEPCREHFDQVRVMLEGMQIAYAVDERLVRGLDYYTRTTFEFLNPALGAQNAVAGGGRYDGLVEEIGGPPTPAIGFAIGEERILASLAGKAQGAELLITNGAYIATVGGVAVTEAMRLADRLRRRGIRAAIDLEQRSLKGQMRQANKDRFRYAVILGSDELARGQVTLKDMVEGSQLEIPLAEVVERLAVLPAREIV